MEETNNAVKNILHAEYTTILGTFLQGADEFLQLEDEVIDRASAWTKFNASIKADAGVGEESFKKEMIPISTYANLLKKKFGDI